MKIYDHAKRKNTKGDIVKAKLSSNSTRDFAYSSHGNLKHRDSGKYGYKYTHPLRRERIKRDRERNGNVLELE